MNRTQNQQDQETSKVEETYSNSNFKEETNYTTPELKNRGKQKNRRN